MVEFTAGTTERDGAESVPDLVFQLAASFVPANNEGQLDYQITGGADAALFELINDAQGVDDWAHLVLAGENWSGDVVDRETKLDADGDGLYVVNVTVTSTLNGAQSTGTFFITVNDVTIDHWMGAVLSYSTDVAVTEVFNASIEEGAANGTQLFEAFSTDGSGSPVYTLTADSSNGAFEIDAVTGIVSVKNGALIDFETMGSGYVITVKSTESANDFVTQDFNIGNSFITITDASDVGETITGTAGADKITPLATVTGQPFPTAKDDKIDGGNGIDHIDGWHGSDRLNGGLGIDTVSYASSTSSAGVTVNLQQQGTSSATGAPTADGSAQSGGAAQGDLLWGFENILGSAKNDTLTGDQFANLIEGGDGDDVLDGGAGIDTLRGDAGNDTIAGNTGNDALDGGTNTAAGDTLDYSYLTAGQNLSVTLGKLDTKTGNVAQSSAVVKSGAVTLETDKVKNFENVTGGAGNDKLTGNAGDNWLTGGDGADILIGGAGADRLHGNLATSVDLGNPGDTADYSASDAGITITISNATYSLAGKGGHAEGDILAGINNIVGSKFNDFLSGDTGFNTTPGGVLSGGAGDDIIRAATNSSGTNILDGGTNGAAGDTIDYSWASNVVDLTIALSNTKDALVAVGNAPGAGTQIKNFENVIGGQGNDTINGNTAANVIEGGAGADKLTGGGGDDTLSYAGSLAGVNVLLFGPVNNVLIFPSGGDADGDIASGFINLLGSAADDTLQGDARNNVINGGAGIDTIFGHDGADTLFGGADADTFNGGLGADKIDGGTSGLDYDAVIYIGVTDGITLTLGANGAAATVSSKTGNAAAGDTLTNIERVETGDGKDALTGNNVAHDFRGGEGADTLVGGTGASVLLGEGGDDIIFASVSNGGKGGDIGIEQYSGGDGFDTLNFSKLTNGVSIDFTGGTPNYIPGTDDVFVFSFERVVGTAKNDVFFGDNAFAMKIDGAAGDDRIVAGLATSEYLFGGAGLDTVSFESLAGAITIDLNGQGKADAPRLTITGGTNNSGEVLTGYHLAEFENVIGTVGNDNITGTSGNNVIEGGAGEDYLYGGLGSDTVSYAGSTNGVSVDLGLGNTTTQANGDAQGDVLTSIENIIGSAHGDTLLGDAGNNTIDGGAGSDELRGFEGKDTLRGGVDKDVFYAGGTSGIGADTYDGGADFDTLTYQDESLGVTVVLGANGASANVTGGPNAAGDKLIGIESVIGGNGNDKFTGNNLAHQLDGSNGDDTLTGGSGDSTVVGQGGNDTIVASIGANELYQGGDDNDTLTFASFGANTVVNVNLATNTHSVTGIGSLIDASGFEILIGGKGNDVLTGNAATATTIQGGGGADIIQGGMAIDTFTGGAGNDTFVLADANQGKDNFTDFTNGDKLQINSTQFGGSLGIGALPDATWLVVGAGAVATNTGGHGQFIYNTTNDTLYWDVDGSGGSGQEAIGQFTSNVTLKLADFALV